MKFQKFELEVKKIIRNLPQKYRRILYKEEIRIIVRREVPRAVKERYPDKTVFGIFIGLKREYRNSFYIQKEPTRIEIYMESFEKYFGSEFSCEMKEQIFKTVVHEIAHYFGFDEKQLRKRGY